MLLKLYNNTTKREINLDNLEDITDSRLFFHFKITLPDGVDDGEYTYTLDEDDVVKASGLLQVGDYVPEKTTYEGNTIKEKNGYISYNG